LQVGDQVPVVTQQAQSVTQENTPLVNSIEQKDTGVILSVTPRVNAGGLVIMDIEQEVSDVIATTSSGIDSPTIQTRKISSSIAVQSGETVALGGMIKEKATNTETGLPFLHKLPIIGALFGTTSVTTVRTELLILLTPRVVGTQGEARAVTDELRRRMRNLNPMFNKVIGLRPPPPAAAAANIGQGTKPQAAPAPAVSATAKSPARMPAPSAAKIEPVAVSGAPWRIQLIALGSRKEAEETWTILRQAHLDLLGALTLHVQRTELPNGTFYRVQAGPLATPATAAELCGALKERNQDCLLVAP